MSLQAIAESPPAGHVWLYVGLFFAGVLLLGLLLIVAKVLHNRLQQGSPSGFRHEDLDLIRNQLSDEELSRLKRTLVGVEVPKAEKESKSDSQLSTSGQNDDATISSEG